MREKINEKVSVITVFSATRRQAWPYLVTWQNRDYKIGQIGYHHTIRDGETLHHIYEVTDTEKILSLRLNLDTANLYWTLEVVSDGNAN
jgi:hypothetical protein